MEQLSSSNQAKPAPAHTDLLPCPFCGGRAEQCDQSGWIACSTPKCPAFNVIATEGDWNRRPEQAAPQDAVSVLEAWEAIGHDTGCNPSKDELLASLRYIAELTANHTAPQSGLSGMVNIRRDLLERIDESAICDGAECSIDAELFLELGAALSDQGSAGV